MGIFRQLLTFCGLMLWINAPVLAGQLGWPLAVAAGAAGFVVYCLPIRKKGETRRLRGVARGALLVVLSSVAAVVQVCWYLPYCLMSGRPFSSLLFGGIWAAVGLFLVMANGVLRLVILSAQAGVVKRVLMLLFWWVPVLNLVLVWQLYQGARLECARELARIDRDAVRVDSEICRTRYPILLVHGVFFRDWQLFNYWGRIPKELQRNGAQIYYGNQQSAASVEQSAGELCRLVNQIVETTGCEKVNIIAHSKGGLDSRWAVSCLGLAPMVASLTTINTPHRGCVWAGKLLTAAPDWLAKWLAHRYNSLFTRLGDEAPDFMAAVNSLTDEACARLNEQAPDQEGILYQSTCSYMNRASGDGFPLNVTYRIVRHYEGQNDGLVAPESARWGTYLGTLEPGGKRGISHGDMIDLHRTELPGFDVREFYVRLVAGLKQRGL